ncbi:hypothetical protein F2Q70_00017032 [Brassica cretica]|uniref:Uncharacterized protein n=1 Tax=Brassica cretica TaxID=69181 RepID=A0A3N6QHA3_BRACR|nr:hypothetical protein F2Q70_00017032 [Brassica cretica]KAF2599671.1 hypothetical protein F2Q68_00009980 [Brassica cretica]
MGFPASRVIPLDPVRQRSTSPGRALPWLDRTQYRFGVQKRQSSFRMGRESNPDGGCHYRPVLSLGLPRPDCCDRVSSTLVRLESPSSRYLI